MSCQCNLELSCGQAFFLFFPNNSDSKNQLNKEIEINKLIHYLSTLFLSISLFQPNYNRNQRYIQKNNKFEQSSKIIQLFNIFDPYDDNDENYSNEEQLQIQSSIYQEDDEDDKEIIYFEDLNQIKEIDNNDEKENIHKNENGNKLMDKDVEQVNENTHEIMQNEIEQQIIKEKETNKHIRLIDPILITLQIEQNNQKEEQKMKNRNQYFSGQVEEQESKQLINNVDNIKQQNNIEHQQPSHIIKLSSSQNISQQNSVNIFFIDKDSINFCLFCRQQLDFIRDKRKEQSISDEKGHIQVEEQEINKKKGLEKQIQIFSEDKVKNIKGQINSSIDINQNKQYFNMIKINEDISFSPISIILGRENINNDVLNQHEIIIQSYLALNSDQQQYQSQQQLLELLNDQRIIDVINVTKDRVVNFLVALNSQFQYQFNNQTDKFDQIQSQRKKQRNKGALKRNSRLKAMIKEKEHDNNLFPDQQKQQKQNGDKDMDYLQHKVKRKRSQSPSPNSLRLQNNNYICEKENPIQLIDNMNNLNNINNSTWNSYHNIAIEMCLHTLFIQQSIQFLTRSPIYQINNKQLKKQYENKNKLDIENHNNTQSNDQLNEDIKTKNENNQDNHIVIDLDDSDDNEGKDNIINKIEERKNNMKNSQDFHTDCTNNEQVQNNDLVTLLQSILIYIEPTKNTSYITELNFNYYHFQTPQQQLGDIDETSEKCLNSYVFIPSHLNRISLHLLFSIVNIDIFTYCLLANYAQQQSQHEIQKNQTCINNITQSQTQLYGISQYSKKSNQFLSEFIRKILLLLIGELINICLIFVNYNNVQMVNKDLKNIQNCLISIARIIQLFRIVFVDWRHRLNEKRKKQKQIERYFDFNNNLFEQMKTEEEEEEESISKQYSSGESFFQQIYKMICIVRAVQSRVQQKKDQKKLIRKRLQRHKLYYIAQFNQHQLIKTTDSTDDNNIQITEMKENNPEQLHNKNDSKNDNMLEEYQLDKQNKITYGFNQFRGMDMFRGLEQTMEGVYLNIFDSFLIGIISQQKLHQFAQNQQQFGILKFNDNHEIIKSNNQISSSLNHDDYSSLSQSQMPEYVLQLQSPFRANHILSNKRYNTSQDSNKSNILSNSTTSFNINTISEEQNIDSLHQRKDQFQNQDDDNIYSDPTHSIANQTFKRSTNEILPNLIAAFMVMINVEDICGVDFTVVSLLLHTLQAAQSILEFIITNLYQFKIIKDDELKTKSTDVKQQINLRAAELNSLFVLQSLQELLTIENAELLKIQKNIQTDDDTLTLLCEYNQRQQIRKPLLVQSFSEQMRLLRQSIGIMYQDLVDLSSESDYDSNDKSSHNNQDYQYKREKQANIILSQVLYLSNQFLFLINVVSRPFVPINSQKIIKSVSFNVQNDGQFRQNHNNSYELLEQINIFTESTAKLDNVLLKCDGIESYRSEQYKYRIKQMKNAHRTWKAWETLCDYQINSQTNKISTLEEQRAESVDTQSSEDKINNHGKEIESNYQGDLEDAINRRQWYEQKKEIERLKETELSRNILIEDGVQHLVGITSWIASASAELYDVIKRRFIHKINNRKKRVS